MSRGAANRLRIALDARRAAAELVGGSGARCAPAAGVGDGPRALGGKRMNTTKPVSKKPVSKLESLIAGVAITLISTGIGLHAAGITEMGLAFVLVGMLEALALLLLAVER